MDKRGKGLAILNDTTYEKMALQVHQLTEVRNLDIWDNSNIQKAGWYFWHMTF